MPTPRRSGLGRVKTSPRRRRAAAVGVDIGWVIDIPRDLEMPDQTATIDDLESSETPDGLVGDVGFAFASTPTTLGASRPT